MIDSQVDPNKNHNDIELSNEELEEVAGGGGILRDVVDATKDFAGNIVEEGKEFFSDLGDAIK